MQCKCASDKQLQKFIHSAELRLGGRKINTNLMRGSKTNSTVVLSTQISRRSGAEEKSRQRSVCVCGGGVEETHMGRKKQVKKTKEGEELKMGGSENYIN